MPVCSKCGVESPDNSKFCLECGSNFSGETGKLDPDSVLENRYVIVKVLGRGGMGAVYQAVDQRLKNTLVAVKEMSTNALGKDNCLGAISAFEKEATMLIGLRHPALPRISDFFSKNDRWYLVMDYIEGETLADVLKKRGCIPESEVRECGIQLCEILDYLHTRTPPVIFRDLKPSNIMITPDGKIKLIDFGIARHFRPGSTNDTAAYGSSGYAPPEQYGDNQTDARSDIYALGAVLHHLLTGKDPIRTPFNFESPGKSVTVSLALESVIMKALELKPSDRPGTAGEMLTLLRDAGNATPEENLTGTVTPPPGGSQTPANATTAIGMGGSTSLITPGQGDTASSDPATSCPKCGQELSPNANFCRNCGAQIDSNPANAISGTEEKPRYFKWVAAILGVLLFGAGAYGFYAWNNTGTSQKVKPEVTAKIVPATPQPVNPPAQPVSSQPPVKDNQSPQNASGGKSLVAESNSRVLTPKNTRDAQLPSSTVEQNKVVNDARIVSIQLPQSVDWKDTGLFKLRIKNSGTTTWNENYFVTINRSGEKVTGCRAVTQFAASVPPGGTLNVTDKISQLLKNYSGQNPVLFTFSMQYKSKNEKPKLFGQQIVKKLYITNAQKLDSSPIVPESKSSQKPQYPPMVANKNTLIDDARILDVELPDVVDWNDDIHVSVKIKNTGSTTWESIQTGSNSWRTQYYLAILKLEGKNMKKFFSMPVNVMTSDISSGVAPGETVTAKVKLHAKSFASNVNPSNYLVTMSYGQLAKDRRYFGKKVTKKVYFKNSPLVEQSPRD